MKKFLKNLAALSVLAIINSCASNEPTKSPVVYVAGNQNNSSGVSIAMYWKNGVAVSLTNGTKDAGLYGIAASGNDVYAVGYEYNNQTTAVAKVWKNGVATSLTNGTRTAFAYSVTTVENDVYVAGYENNNSGYSVATYWKNGVATVV